jgi:hypothetical protein
MWISTPATRSAPAATARPSASCGGIRARAATLLVVLSVVLASTHARAAPPCVDASPLGSVATVHRALLLATSLPRASAARQRTELARDACREVPDASGDCPQFDVARCRDALRSLYDALSQGSRADDAVTRNFSRVVRAGVSATLSRRSWTAGGDTRGAGPAESASTRTPATIQVIGDGRVLRIRPLRSLRARRRYQLVVTGLPEDHLAHWYAGSGSTPGAKLQEDLSQAYESVLSGETLQFPPTRLARCWSGSRRMRARCETCPPLRES